MPTGARCKTWAHSLATIHEDYKVEAEASGGKKPDHMYAVPFAPANTVQKASSGILTALHYGVVIQFFLFRDPLRIHPRQSRGLWVGLDATLSAARAAPVLKIAYLILCGATPREHNVEIFGKLCGFSSWKKRPPS
ncbi:hypothetical protein HPB50_002497 [Hyalomma asiaticum]|uniref:Uncharacterized protein n=1 Tax=Hyalomma asiaticum TaxID=266040 RepID=A0ACB7SM16_HYAAI|nr:hypothetical protein HPB50_002497 [Hyalomma asiaticum]